MDDNDILEAVFRSSVGGPPYKYQLDMIASSAKLLLVNKSRRTGISTVMGLRGLLTALKGGTALLVSPSLRQSTLLMTDYVRRFLEAFPTDEIPDLIEDSKSVLRFDGGGVVYSLPNQSHTIRGFTPDFVGLDEAAHFLNNTDRQVYGAVLPMLALGATMWIVSTPFGDKGVFAELSHAGPGYVKMTINWKQRPDLIARVAELRAEFDETTFAQEFNNEFRGEVSSEFPRTLIEPCIDSEMQYETNARGDVAGADIGRRVDLTAVAVIRYDAGVVRLVEKLAWRNVPLPEQEARFIDIAGRVGKFIFDRGGMGEQMGDSIPARTSNAVPVLFSNEIKTEMFLGLRRLFEQHAIRIPDDPRLIASLGSVHRYYRTGRLIIDAERKDETGHADEATALALACWSPKPQDTSIVDTSYEIDCITCHGRGEGCLTCGGSGKVKRFFDF